MYMLILNFTYPLRCLHVPPVEYHCSKEELKDIIKSNENKACPYFSPFSIGNESDKCLPI
jgi:hypothetical protein